MNWADVLPLTPQTQLALVGAGGKTSLLFALARAAGRAVISTTTHLGTWQAAEADRHQIVEGRPPAALDLFADGVTLLTGHSANQRLTAPDPDFLYWLRENLDAPLLLEADGARGLPLKAPAGHEPAIPAWATDVLVVAGLRALGKPLAQAVFRPEIAARLLGIAPETRLSAEHIAALLAHPQGGLKGIPAGARRRVVLTQADTPERQAAAGKIARRLLGTYPEVFITGDRPQPLAAYTKVAGVLLAGGASHRFGAPKQTLPWRDGRPLVRVVAETALAAGLDPLVVVTGAHAEAVRQALRDLPLTLAHNPTPAAGQSASIRAGLAALPPDAGAAFFLLADQPQVTPAVLHALIEEHRRTRAAVIAPLVDGQRANPVLFDRRTFSALAALQGDIGGRGIFHRFSPHYLEWLDAGLLADIDTPADYHRLLEAR